jgi:hypothetical protein
MCRTCGESPERPVLERPPLLDSEPVLLVHDRDAQRPESDLRLDQRMRADDDQRSASGDLGDGGAPLGRRRPLHERDDAHAKGREQLGEADQVLRRQRLGRRHEGALAVALDRPHQGMGGDSGLARADIALQQPPHRFVAGDVGVDGLDRPRLRPGELERERRAVAGRELAGRR